jgi:sulfite reductase alpha subunit-like flavoprotein
MKIQAGAGLKTNADSNNRLFVYEVEGLRQNKTTDLMDYPIRKSGNVLIAVPYSRMNQEMKRITRMGGKIVSIKNVDEAATNAESSGE